ncbi:MAG: hypothetical protein HYZ93_05220 [Candidatus Omnitrophica bacterium]|nr:hypothetical protein [Candidatus Omnitrophota bacterium]
MRLRDLLWVSIWLIVLAGAGFLFAIRSYRVFTEEELVAVVRCEAPAKGSPHRFLLSVTPVAKGVPESARSYGMVGDQWAIGGEILKWHPWLNLAGIKSCHKLTRLSSRYLKARAEQAEPRSVYDLNGGTSPMWQWLYRFQQWLPFVEAVYGNATYVMAQPGSRWGVYVSLSGYLVKPLPPERPQR